MRVLCSASDSTKAHFCTYVSQGWANQGVFKIYLEVLLDLVQSQLAWVFTE